MVAEEHTHADKPEESKAEKAKRESRFLRGTIVEALAGPESHVNEDDAQVLKAHGGYQQYDRDARRTGGAGKAERHYFFMVRIKIPAGVLTAEQYLALDAVADELTGGSLRITSRQDFQLHVVPKRHLKATIARINHVLLTTLGACGDVVRNVMACPAPLADEPHRRIRALAMEISRELLPRSRAYRGIWLEEWSPESAASSDSDEEPFYGATYLPRKFKVGITLPDDNSVDIYAEDVGLVALPENGRVRGVNILVGGGMGLTHNKADTFARLATPLGYADIAHAVEVVRIVAAIFRDYGNRADRRHARLKYLIHERGMDWFREEFQRRASFELRPFVEIGPLPYHDYAGAHSQGDGRWFYGLVIENGRIRDFPQRRIKTGIRALIQELRPGIILTPAQDLLLTGLDDAAIPRVEAILDEHGIPRPTQLSAARRYGLACPALPTCGLAIADAERIMPVILDQFEQELQRLGLTDEPITIRMTGCPNGCSRPYTADIAFVGRSPDRYNIYVGGRLAGDRLVDLYAEKVPQERLLATLQPLLAAWRDQRLPGEGFGDYYRRTYGPGVATDIFTGAMDPVLKPESAGPAE